MSDTLQIFGKTYEGVTGLVAKDSGGVDVIYTAGASANLQSNKNVASSSSTFIVAPDSGYDGLEQVTVTGMPEMAIPNISYAISSSGMLDITAYIYEGYSPGYGVGQSNQLATASGSTIVPSSSSQIAVASGKYTTGDIIVAAAPSANLQDNKTVDPSGVQQVILPDFVPTETLSAGMDSEKDGNIVKFTCSTSEYDTKYIKGLVHFFDSNNNLLMSARIDGLYEGQGGSDNLQNITTITLENPDYYWVVYNVQVELQNYRHAIVFWVSADIISYATIVEPIVFSDRYDGLKQVTVNGAPLQAKTVTPSSSQQIITPDTRTILLNLPVGDVAAALSWGDGYIDVPSPEDGKTYHIEGKLHTNTSPNVEITINGDAVYNNSSGTDLQSIATISGTTWYGSGLRWQSGASGGWGTYQGISVKLNLSYTGNLYVAEEFSITEGTIDYYGLSSVTVEPISEPVVSDAVRFIDYDGSIVYTYSANDFLVLTAMPSNPTHEGLTAQGWNWDLEEAQEYVEEWGYVDIGQQYVTSSGNTEIDIEIPTDSKRLEPYLGLGINGTVQIDWGDGSTSTATGSSMSTQVRTGHTYVNTGKYTISIHATSGNYCLLGTSTYYLLSGNFSNSNRNRVYANYVKAVRIGSGNSSYNNHLGEYCFHFCTGLEYVTIPNLTNVIREIPNSAFNSCYDLKCIILSKSMTSATSFLSCYNLKYIVFSDTSITLGQISNSYSLDSLIFSKNSYINSIATLQADNFLFRKIIPYLNIKEINQPYDIQTVLSNMTQTRSCCFCGVNNFTEVVIPSNITSVGTNSFANCKKLKKITLSHSVTSNSSIFYGCYALEEVTLPSDFNNSTTFYQCYNLKKVNYTPNSLGSSTFYNCQSLKSIALSSSLTTIPNQTFYNCQSLQSIAFPSTLTTTNTNSLTGCYCLSNLTIPASVTTISNQTFSNNYGMKEYHFLGTTPPTLSSTNAFNNIPDDCIIYVPYSADHSVLNAYQTATNWSTYASKIQEEPQ